MSLSHLLAEHGTDPLALSAGTPARLVLALLLLALLWGGVAWAMTA